jgi:hypothetical protein
MGRNRNEKQERVMGELNTLNYRWNTEANPT